MSYSKPKLAGKVQTVLCLISPDEMGITLSHEHCLVDLSCLVNEPTSEIGKKLAHEPVSFDNVGYIRYHRHENRDNVRLLDEGLTIKEFMFFKQAGGQTVVDCSNVDIGRNPIAIKRISQSTGLNIIMSTGYYTKPSQKLHIMDKRSEEDIGKEFLKELSEGVMETDIRCGAIGEIGCSWPLADCERKVVRAAGIAQRESGAPLVIHPGRSEDAPAEIVEILREVGTDLTHTVISHTSRTMFVPKNRYNILDAGCYLAYDMFGYDGYYPDSFPDSRDLPAPIDILTDTQRIAQIKDLISHGFGKQILISQDICFKCSYMSYGGHGYAHILNNVVPVMRRRGISEDQINDLLRGNPKRFYTFR